jgi:glycosyltransferase involved in cell wall biosynthesis
MDLIPAPHRVTVVMCTFNGAQFVTEQVRSIRQQTYPLHELIVSDDGSNDETLDLVARETEDAPFAVRIHRNEERLGFRENFIRAAAMADPGLVAFSDQDDIWLPEKLSRTVGHFDDPSVLLAHHDAHIMAPNGALVGRLHQTGQFADLTEPLSEDPWQISHGFTQVMRSELCKGSRFWSWSIDPDRENSRMAHDQWFYFLASNLGRVAYCPEPLAHYRQHGGNAAGWVKPYGIADRIRAWCEDRSRIYARCAEAASARSLILEALDSEGLFLVPPGAKELYDELAELYRLRAALYAEPTLSRRLGALRDLIGRNGYSSEGSFTFTPKGLAKDLAAGVLGGARAVGVEPKGGDPTCRSTRKLRSFQQSNTAARQALGPGFSGR